MVSKLTEQIEPPTSKEIERAEQDKEEQELSKSIKTARELAENWRTVSVTAKAMMVNKSRATTRGTGGGNM